MARARPILATVVLSAAAALGYVSYRFIFGTAELPATATQAQANLVERLPEFALAGLDGEPLAITSWPGKPLVINFWATWCVPCRREIPMLKEFQDENPELQVVGIAIDDPALVVDYAAEMQFNYPIMSGQTGAWEAAAAFGVELFALPFTIFTAADGAVLGVHTGELHAEHLENFTAVLGDLAAARIGTPEARARISRRM